MKAKTITKTEKKKKKNGMTTSFEKREGMEADLNYGILPINPREDNYLFPPNIPLDLSTNKLFNFFFLQWKEEKGRIIVI